ncbi:hypothetical protein DACRYDRAFT_105962 [Dacryopinax primogenitus]|uniref:WW domain-containing protein n=1 Tax=Dacryopinax primogenitus (strain DJM 731) TaxID=1858805 RepID=M5G6H6_DACPD|nr:uncharacterized protein DACRYDRAFT_105962 [Dacryopinax primogenitus]EJU03810.1 hypothetical protein DACRYDRAFT_105962 [Dacryopinax primogenitus]
MSTLWTEHRNSEGRTYWYNNDSRQSVWEKPDALKTPFERALANTPWKEYVANGRKYWYNTENKQSKWDMPDELTQLVTEVENNIPSPARLEPKTNAAATGTFGSSVTTQHAIVGTTPTTFVPAQVPLSNGTATGSGALGFVPATRPSISLPISTTSSLPSRPNLPPDPVIPQGGFATSEEGEKAFMHLLRKAGVDATWTWDQTMRAIITDPLYKSLKSLAEKKAAWQKYVEDLKAKEADEKEARLQRLRPAFKSLLSGSNNVYYYTTFRSAEKIFLGNPTWSQVKLEAERRMLFEEYVGGLMEKQTAATREMRTRNISKVVALLKELDVNVTTRWRNAQAQVLASKQWAEDAELRQLAPLDMLLAFEDYSRVLERDYEEVHRKRQIERTRDERKAREEFRVLHHSTMILIQLKYVKELLDELQRSGLIKAKSKWKTVYPYLDADPRYLTLLGTPGSTPLELFWDVADELSVKLDTLVTPVERVLAEHAFVFDHKTSSAEFHRFISEVVSLAHMPQAEESEIYDHLRDRALRRYADEKRRAERRLRHLQDDLRYALKKLDPPLDLDSAFEDAVPRIADLEEYKVLADDEGRRGAFIKFVKRQKEKLREVSEDGGSATSRKRKDSQSNGRSRRDYDLEHDREQEKPSKTSHHDGERYNFRRQLRDHERDKRHDKDKERDADRERERPRNREDVDHEKGHRSRQREERRSSRRSGRDEGNERDREWDESHRGGNAASKREREGHQERDGRERGEWSHEKSHRELSEERPPKRPRVQDSPSQQSPIRAETPEEGEI